MNLNLFIIEEKFLNKRTIPKFHKERILFCKYPLQVHFLKKPSIGDQMCIGSNKDTGSCFFIGRHKTFQVSGLSCHLPTKSVHDDCCLYFSATLPPKKEQNSTN